MAESAELYVSGHFAQLIQKPTFHRDAEAAGLNAHQRELAHGAVAAQPDVSPERLNKVDMELGPALQMMEGCSKTMTPLFGAMFFAALLLFIGVGSLLGGLIFGVAPMLRVFGLARSERASFPN